MNATTNKEALDANLESITRYMRFSNAKDAGIVIAQALALGATTDQILAAAGIPAASCGLNADWSVDAWLVGPGVANRTNGALYLLDNEDGDEDLPGTYNVARRYYNDNGDNDEITYLGQGLDLAGAVALIRGLLP